MIIYFADRELNILGHASTSLPEGPTITDDLKIEDVETGVASFECSIPFEAETREQVNVWAAVGNYILRSHENENEFYTIIDFEEDTEKQEVYIYAEDAGLDLLNEVVGPYEADKAYSIDHYINKFAYDSGFAIGTNEAADLTRKLSWDGEATAAERIASVATQFDGCEISYSFDVKGLEVTNKYINIHKERGKDIGAQLRLNKEIDRIITKKSIANLATALEVTGGTPETEGEEEAQPITLSGYKYDDGDFYVKGTRLLSREALKKWSRYNWTKEPNQLTGEEGHIVKLYSYDTTSQKELCSHAVTELKKLCDIEVNYEVDIKEFPENIKVGDRVNIIDDAGELYVSARVLRLDTSVVNQEQTATIGEYLIKGSGISQKVADLAAQFAKASQSAARAKVIAEAAKADALAAKDLAESADLDATLALAQADAAKTAAEAAQTVAADAQAKADQAAADVDNVGKSVESLETTVANAQAAADQAHQAAETAQTKATEAHEAAVKAQQDAEEAATAAGTAQSTAASAIEKAETAEGTAGEAKTKAEEAATTAAAAKLDAEAAKEDIDSLGERLTTLSNTMSADYARKTDLTETEASLQTQISQNAAQISSTASKVQTIDETANNAAEQAQAAQAAAGEAQAQADQATADAQAAQTAADTAVQAAANAQSQADTAKTAAETAQSVADKAEADLEAAKADLATVQGRVDATEADIAAAQEAVNTAQAAADQANAEAEAAAKKATDAQTAAETAVTNAANAQTVAQEAADKATIAQAAADEAKGDAATAQATADEAKTAAQNAQATANTAKTNAENAQAKADEAAATAATAQQAAADADAKAAQAQTDLDTAKANLSAVTSRVDATEEEVAAAQEAVETAQAAADKAKEDAEAAQATANTAKTKAATAQAAADTAKAAADAAQQAANEAQAAADAAQRDVDALAVRVTKTETDISQTSEKITLLATKEEVAQTLGGYYTKEETDAAIEVSAGEINLSVDSKIEGVQIGGRNLLLKSRSFTVTGNRWTGWTNHASYTFEEDDEGFYIVSVSASGLESPLYQSFYSCVTEVKTGDTFTVSCWFKVDDVAALDNRKVYIFEVYSEAGERLQWDDCSLDRAATETVESGKWVKLVSKHTVTCEGENLNCGLRLCLFQNGSVHYKKCKMEIGNKATDWTPAPEDVDAELGNRYTKAETEALIKVEADKIATQVTRIDALGERTSTLEQTAEGLAVEVADAAKKATDFLSYDADNGLQVGNKTSGEWSGYRTQVKSDSFNILDSEGNELATYGANKIGLGKNNEETVIELCGGHGEIKAYGQGYGVVLEGEDVAKLHAGAFAEIRGSVVKGDASNGYQVQQGIVQAQSGGGVIIVGEIWESDETGWPVGTVGERSQIYVDTNSISMKNDKEVYINTPIVTATGDVQATGGITSGGDIVAEGKLCAGDNVRLYSSTEGGNIQMTSPNGVVWEMDTYGDGFRIFFNNGSNVFPFHIDGSTGVISLNKGIVLSAGITYSGYGRHITWPVTSGTLLLTTNSAGNGLNLPYIATGSTSWTKNFLQIVPSTPAMVVGASGVAMTYGGSSHTFASQITANGGVKFAFGDGKGVRFSTEGQIYSTAKQNMYFMASTETNYRLFLGVTDSTWALCPQTTGMLQLGTNNHRWGTIYTASSSIVTSDRNAKNKIEALTDKHVDFFTRLQPVSFAFINGTSGRTHIGFISQDVEEAMLASGLDNLDFAGFCKDQKTEVVEKVVEVEREVIKEVTNEAGEIETVTETIIVEETVEETVPIEGEYVYSLRYEEFIALNTHMIQKQQAEIESLKLEMETLKTDVEALKAAVFK